MCSYLYQKGVQHRDFKSPNALLQAEVGGGVRAKVTDRGVELSADMCTGRLAKECKCAVTHAVTCTVMCTGAQTAMCIEL